MVPPGCEGAGGRRKKRRKEEGKKPAPQPPPRLDPLGGEKRKRRGAAEEHEEEWGHASGKRALRPASPCGRQALRSDKLRRRRRHLFRFSNSAHCANFFDNFKLSHCSALLLLTIMRSDVFLLAVALVWEKVCGEPETLSICKVSKKICGAHRVKW